MHGFGRTYSSVQTLEQTLYHCTYSGHYEMWMTSPVEHDNLTTQPTAMQVQNIIVLVEVMVNKLITRQSSAYSLHNCVHWAELYALRIWTCRL